MCHRITPPLLDTNTPETILSRKSKYPLHGYRKTDDNRIGAQDAHSNLQSKCPFIINSCTYCPNILHAITVCVLKLYRKWWTRRVVEIQAKLIFRPCSIVLRLCGCCCVVVVILNCNLWITCRHCALRSCTSVKCFAAIRRRNVSVSWLVPFWCNALPRAIWLLGRIEWCVWRSGSTRRGNAPVCWNPPSSALLAAVFGGTSFRCFQTIAQIARGLWTLWLARIMRLHPISRWCWLRLWCLQQSDLATIQTSLVIFDPVSFALPRALQVGPYRCISDSNSPNSYVSLLFSSLFGSAWIS